MQAMLMDVLRALATPNMDIRKKTLDIALDLITQHNIDEVGAPVFLRISQAPSIRLSVQSMTSLKRSRDLRVIRIDEGMFRMYNKYPFLRFCGQQSQEMNCNGVGWWQMVPLSACSHKPANKLLCRIMQVKFTWFPASLVNIATRENWAFLFKYVLVGGRW